MTVVVVELLTASVVAAASVVVVVGDGDAVPACLLKVGVFGSAVPPVRSGQPLSNFRCLLWSVACTVLCTVVARWPPPAATRFSACVPEPGVGVALWTSAAASVGTIFGVVAAETTVGAG
jgi:hypothetical protein